MKKLFVTILLLSKILPTQTMGVETVPTTADVTVAWDQVDRAQWYWLRWSEENKVPFPNKNKLIRSPGTSTKGTVKNLEIGKTYYFAVTAHANVTVDGVKKIISSKYSDILEYTVTGKNIVVRVPAPINIRVEDEISIIEVIPGSQ